MINCRRELRRGVPATHNAQPQTLPKSEVVRANKRHRVTKVDSNIFSRNCEKKRRRCFLPTLKGGVSTPKILMKRKRIQSVGNRAIQRTFSLLLIVAVALLVSDPISWAGDVDVNMVLIPAGEFVMGGNDNQARSDEKPVHTVYLDAFYIDTHEVTNAEYKKVP